MSPAASGGEKRVLQAIIAVLSFIPIIGGGAGVLFGPAYLGLDAPWPTDLDSHYRYLCGIFLGLGLGFLSCVPDIEHKTTRVRLLGLCVVIGGLARLLSLLMAGTPSAAHLGGLGMELVVTPLLVLWQARIAARR